MSNMTKYLTRDCFILIQYLSYADYRLQSLFKNTQQKEPILIRKIGMGSFIQKIIYKIQYSFMTVWLVFLIFMVGYKKDLPLSHIPCSYIKEEICCSLK